MNKQEEKVMNDHYEFCLSTCSERRLIKIKTILMSCRKLVNKDLTKLNIDDVVRFLSKLNQSKYTDWTKNDYKKIFKRFIKWYYKDLEMIEGMKVKEGFKGVNRLRAFNKEKINKNTLLKPEELEKLLRGSKTLKWKALISLMYESGFRPCEITALKWKDLKFDDSQNICRVWTLSPKTKTDREVPVRDCIVHLKRYREEYPFSNRKESDFVFPSQKAQNKPMGYGVITEMFKRICKNAKTRNIFPYLLRHTRIYELQKKLPEKIASKFAGHSVETSEIYNHLDSDDVEESMMKEIYATKELNEDERTKLEKEVDEMKKQMKEMKKDMIKMYIDENNDP